MGIREDPLAAVWSTELEVLLEREPSLTGTTLLEYLEEHYLGHYDQRILRTLQRRIKQSKTLNGPDREVIFRQQAVVAQQGFYDFTHLDSAITIQEEPFKHLYISISFGLQRLAFGDTGAWRRKLCILLAACTSAGRRQPD